jgi:hypothetical protein
VHRRDVLRGAAAGLGVGSAGFVATRAASAHEGGGDGDGTVGGDATEGYDPLGVVDVPGAREAVVVDDRIAYVATGDGYATVDLSDPTEPRVLARRTDLRSADEDGPLVNVQDVTVDGDTLVVAAPAHPRRNALAGVVVVDVSDPADPRERGFFQTDFPVHNCDVADGRAYLTGNDGDRNALVIVDVARESPAEIGSWSLLDEDAAWGSVEPARRTLHDVTVHDGVAVCACWDAGTWLVDVSEPTDTTVLGRVEAPAPGALRTDGPAPAVTGPGNHHYATLDATGTLLAVGKESFGVRVDDDGDGYRDRTVGGPSGVDLWDVSEPAAPVAESTIPPPPSDDPTRRGTWTTAHNLDLREGTLYTSWYRGGVKRHDVTDPASPVAESWWRAPGEASFWTARAVTTGPDGFFVGSSRGVDSVPGRLYTFPDRRGSQSEPPSLGASSTATPSPSTADSSVTLPGFGPVAGLAALGLGGWWLRRRGHD